ncbi:MAG: hypothetical protein JO366_15975 [Methylobacteriaceae bacterium]|nr:hypothetical protein [Methylobacteriaceae bacterium]MBV9217936.1 hypothetical protein [Methylobacteriaceae bacterium]MBV9246296.1 hypothetical protein [Methylobacteriaceae bacterium]MBV9635188.1 hypothetical protein [Methylobacteriaceae bacterium]MBV9701278.1 hypothetical protein [Methylobacteriaceae bacterium]
MRRAAAIISCLAAGHAASALDAARADGLTRPGMSLPACTCRYKGANVPLGTRVCLSTPEGPRMAECVVELNVTSWRPGKDPCQETSRLLPSAASQTASPL